VTDTVKNEENVMILKGDKTPSVSITTYLYNVIG